MGKQSGNPTRLREVAQIVTPDPINPVGRTFEVIDTDFHFLPEWESVRRYLPEPWQAMVSRLPISPTDYSPDQANYGFNKFVGNGQDKLGVARNADDVLRTLDQIGVEKVILTPGFPGPQNWFNDEMITAISRAYNDYLINEVMPASDRIYGNIMICQRDPQSAAAEIRRCAPNPKFAGVYGNFGGRMEPLGAPRHDVMYDAMTEFNLPLTLHTGGFQPSGTALMNGIRTWTELFGVMQVTHCMLYTASMIMQGVFDKYPDLKVLLQEGGIWWSPEMALRLDEFYVGHSGDIRFCERKLEAGEKFLRRMPSEYLWENFRFATQPICIPASETHFEYLLELSHAEDTFCYSSDWPHATFDPINWVFEHPKTLPEAFQKKILSGNTRKMYPRVG